MSYSNETVPVTDEEYQRAMAVAKAIRIRRGIAFWVDDALRVALTNGLRALEAEYMDREQSDRDS